MIKSLDAFCHRKIFPQLCGPDGRFCPLPLLGTRTRPTSLGLEIDAASDWSCHVKKTRWRSSRRSNKFISQLFGKTLSAASKKANLWKSFWICLQKICLQKGSENWNVRSFWYNLRADRIGWMAVKQFYLLLSGCGRGANSPMERFWDIKEWIFPRRTWHEDQNCQGEELWRRKWNFHEFSYIPTLILQTVLRVLGHI